MFTTFEKKNNDYIVNSRVCNVKNVEVLYANYARLHLCPILIHFGY